MNRIAKVAALVVALALGGCDQVNQLIGVVGTDYRPPLKTAAIKGKVVDRNGNALESAKVSNGAAICYTGYATSSTNPTPARVLDDKGKAYNLGPGEYVLTKVSADTMQYVTAEYDGQKSSPLQTLPTSATFDGSKADDTKRGLDVVPDIKVAVDGPVDSNSSAVQLMGNSAPGNLVNAVNSSATASAALRFTPDPVALYLKTPPNGKGDTARAYKVTYFGADKDPSRDSALSSTDIGTNGIIRQLSAPVTFLPGTSVSSGPMNEADVSVSNSASQFATYLRANNEVKVKIELFSSADDSTAMQDRNRNNVSTVITLRFQQ